MTILYASVLAVALGWAAMKLLIGGGHLRRALLWAPLWGVLLGFWSAAPQIVTAHAVPGSGAFGWLGAYLLLLLGFAAFGLVCAIPAGGLLTALQRVPPFRGRDPEWMFALGMVAALPVGCVLLELLLAAATGRPPVVLEQIAFGGRYQVSMEVAAVCITFVVYRRATRRRWTTVVLAVPLVLFSLAGAAALPLRVDRPPSGREYLTSYTEPRFAVVADKMILADAAPSSLPRT